MDVSLLKPGDRISEYVLEERVGRGGFGDVWRARHHAWPERVVAVKVPGSAERAALLKREGTLQDRVRHANAVEVIGVDAEHDPPYLIMEYVDGESLRARLVRERHLAPAVAVDIGVQLLGALAHAHARGVVHRDLKPENVLLSKEGMAKLTDFGLGRLLEDERARLALSGNLLSQDGRDISGTIAYMAPEQREPGRPVDARADLYAFGIVLFEMLTGARPEGGEAPSDLVGGLDPRLDTVFRRCYCRVEKRYHTAAEIVADLAPLVARSRVTSAAGPLAEPIARLEVAGAGWADRKFLGAEPFPLVGGARIEHADGTWWIVDPRHAGTTRVYPAHVPGGRRPEEFAEKVGSARLRLGEGMRIETGGPVAYEFHDGRPAEPLEVGEIRTAACRTPASKAVQVAVVLAMSALLGLAFMEGGGRRGLLPFAFLAVYGLIFWKVATVDRPPSYHPLPPLAAEPWAPARVLAIGRPAGFMIRALALAIDLGIFAYLGKFLGPRSVVGYLAYDWLFTGLFGATIGKFILGLRVVGDDGAPIGVVGALGRTLSKILSFLPLGVGFLLAGFTPSKQALHDFFAGTRVIRVPRVPE